jgi:hypothetical protein
MYYFSELWDGAEFTLGGTLCRKLGRTGYLVIGTGQQLLVGNGRFKVKVS